MTTAEYVASRGITEVVHFTTDQGLLGTLATKELKPRSLLPEDKYIEHIVKMNCPDRSRDPEWHGHISMSIERINSYLFDISAGKWHPTHWWCVLAFDPIILSHEGVVFATTNNVYDVVQRGSGLAGIESLYAPAIRRFSNRTIRRPGTRPLALPTCDLAEVLYPGPLSISYLRTIYVMEGQHSDAVSGMYAALGMAPLPCVIEPAKFK